MKNCIFCTGHQLFKHMSKHFLTANNLSIKNAFAIDKQEMALLTPTFLSASFLQLRIFSLTKIYDFPGKKWRSSGLRKIFENSESSATLIPGFSHWVLWGACKLLRGLPTVAAHLQSLRSTPTSRKDTPMLRVNSDFYNFIQTLIKTFMCMLIYLTGTLIRILNG